MRSLHSDKIQTDSSDETLPFVPEEGDFGRFDRIYHEYAARLVVFARRFVTEKFAEDIVQDVFVRVWQQGRFRLPSEELSRYLYCSVLNAFRTSLAELRLGEVEYELRILDEPRNEREDVLRALIEQLPERCREVFRLSWYEDLKSAEIAERLGISHRTVDAQLYKALRFLRERMLILLIFSLIFPPPFEWLLIFFSNGVGNFYGTCVLHIKRMTDERNLRSTRIRPDRLSRR